MRLNPALIFVLLLLAALAFVFSSVPALPAMVATHFNARGEPNGFSTREQYRTLMLALMLIVPLSNVALLTWLPKKFPRSLNIPHRKYWLEPERAAETLGFLRDQGFRLGSLFVLLMAGLHWRILEAHKSHPPRLPMDFILIVLPLFLAGVALWSAALWMKFRKRPEPPFGDGL